jgi:Rrf2 family transcriptional regulator, iron-sulfur cluster assembly transcription factor
MIYTRSTQYAIRAMLYLAHHSNQGLCRIEKIAKQADIPQAFLAKLIQRLVKKNLIHSIRGTKGGVRLNVPAEQITLFMIADSIEDFSNGNMLCALGDYECSESSPCGVHERWTQIRDLQFSFLNDVTIAALVSAGVKKKARGKK